MASSLVNLVNNLSGGIHKIKCKYGHSDKKCETCRIKYNYCNSFPEYTDSKDDLIEYNCLCCKKNYQQKFDEKLIEQSFNAYKLFNYDNSKFNYCSEKVFISTNISMIGKNLMEHRYLEKKIL